MLSRRTFLLGGVASITAAAGGLVAVDQGWLPGRIPLRRALGQCEVGGPPPDVAAGDVRILSFASAARGTDVEWVLAVPPGVDVADLPVVLVLHGRGGNARAMVGSLGLDRFLTARVDAGHPPFALVSVDGGETYWHPRDNGDDPIRMITDELLPRVREVGLAADQIGVVGWSMGGHGALLLGRESALGRLDVHVAAAAALSPALFPSFSDAATGAFDSAEDFATYGNLIAEPGGSATVPIYVACGDTDAFTSAIEEYREQATPTPAGGISRGCHDTAYWRSQAPAVLAFLGGHLVADG